MKIAILASASAVALIAMQSPSFAAAAPGLVAKWQHENQQCKTGAVDDEFTGWACDHAKITAKELTARGYHQRGDKWVEGSKG